MTIAQNKMSAAGAKRLLTLGEDAHDLIVIPSTALDDPIENDAAE